MSPEFPEFLFWRDVVADSLEQQMHQFLIEQEEERCRALEAEYSQQEKTRGKRVRRREIPKPWRRPGTHALCQDADLLIMVGKYDYDLSNKRFQAYCIERGVLHVAGEEGSTRWKYYVDHGKPKPTYLNDRFFQFAQPHKGKKYRYTDAEMESGWKTIVLGRAQLQDCWELHCIEVSDNRRS